MAHFIIRITALATDDPDASALISALRHGDTRVDVFERVTDLETLSPEASAIPDAILVPLRLRVAHGAAACLILRSHEWFSAVPIMALIPGRDAALVSSLYSAGADSVVSAPYDIESVRGQLHALVRRRRFFEEYFRPTTEETAGSLAVSALQSLAHGCLIVEGQKTVIFANDAAYALIGANPQGPVSAFDSIVLEAALAANSGALQRSEIIRPDGQRVSVLVTTAPLAEGVRLLELHDAALVNHLDYRLVEALRTRSLSLITAAGSLSLLASKLGQVPLAPINKLQALLLEERTYCSLSQVTRALLEIVDVVANPQHAVKVSLASDPLVGVRFSDAFVLLGHLLLHALDMAGPTGQTSLTAQEYPEDNIVDVTISSEFPALELRSVIESSLIQSCRSGDLSLGAGAETRLPVGLEAAQRVADRYETQIQLKESPQSLKLRIALPLQRSEVISTSEWVPPQPNNK